MDNNDILIRLRYALDIKDTDMVKIFKLGGIDVTKEDVLEMLTGNTEEHKEANMTCNNLMIESFLNGFIVFKRGKQEQRPDQPDRPALAIKDNGSVNNVMLKKIKIALALSSEDMLDILRAAGVTVTKGELSALFRKEGHKHYKECGDNYARNFLKGLALKYRKR